MSPSPKPRYPPRTRRILPAGKVTSAEFALREPPFIRKQSVKGKRAAGIRYERKTQLYLDALANYYIPSPWLIFTAEGHDKPRWCQPDGLYINLDTGRITLVEVKLQHTAQSWWQLRKLYEPVIRHIFGTKLFTYSVCEVVRWLDPHTSFPETFSHVESPLLVPSGKFGVHIHSRTR